MKRLVATLALSVVALAAAACSSGPAPTTVPPGGPSATPSQPAGSPSTAVTLTARNIAFTAAELDVKAGTGFTIDFQNPDGAPHNVSIFAADGSKVFGGDIVEGGKSILYQVPAIGAGTYTFKCDIHPDMKGTVVAR